MMGRYDWGYDMMYGGAGWFGSLLMVLFALLFVAGIVLLVVWAVRHSSAGSAAGGQSPGSGAVGHDEAVAVAKRRLASGEITAEQYAEIMRTLGGP